MRFFGRIFDACTIAPVSPASRSSWRNALFKHDAGGGLEAEADVGEAHDGVAKRQFALIRRVPSMVSSALRRSSSMPVEIGSTSGSKEDVLIAQAVFHRQIADALGDGYLAVGGAGHGVDFVFVDGARDDGRAIFFGQVRR